MKTEKTESESVLNIKRNIEFVTVDVEPLRQCHHQESGANQDRLKSL